MGSISSPTVYDSKIFVLGVDGIMYALDSATGTVKWSNSGGPEGVGISALVAGQGLIFGADRHARVTAMDAITGVEAWVYDVDAVGNYVPLSNVTYSNGCLFGGSNKKKLTMFDASGGQVKWTYQTPSEVYSGPCILDADGKTHNSGDSGMQD
jgi:outer membrane protein assembly factor BamB